MTAKKKKNENFGENGVVPPGYTVYATNDWGGREEFVVMN